jgi:hypothetical protein
MAVAAAHLRVLAELEYPDMRASRRSRILVLPMRVWLQLIRGETRVMNLPADACIVAMETRGSEIWIRVQSDRYPRVCDGQPIPVMPALIQAMRE